MILGITASQMRTAAPTPAGLTWDPDNTDPVGIILSDGNRVATSASTGASHRLSRATVLHNAGDWYVEIVPTTAVSATEVSAGFAAASMPLTFSSIAPPGDYCFFRSNGQVFTSGGVYGGAFGAYIQNDVLGFAYKADSGEVRIYKNGALLKTLTLTPGLDFAPCAVLTSTPDRSLEIRATPLYLPAGYTYWG